LRRSASSTPFTWLFVPEKSLFESTAGKALAALAWNEAWADLALTSKVLNVVGLIFGLIKKAVY
jgi:hypothetical protein